MNKHTRDYIVDATLVITSLMGVMIALACEGLTRGGF